VVRRGFSKIRLVYHKRYGGKLPAMYFRTVRGHRGAPELHILQC
jgi:hypothetical protein